MSSSIGRNSLIMASGTAASRITGQIRTILLAAAIGTTGMAANAYQAGSMIPQVIFTLVSGGVFNAVLVPHITRTLNSDNAQETLDKIVTFALTLLLGATVIIAALTPVLTRIYVNGSPDLVGLSMAFMLWCTPQIFFYGLHMLLGQILAVKNRFGAYAWSSVGANVISCLGFGVFIAMFGNAAQQPIGFWTPATLALTAGTWTLGVAFQGLVLLIPLKRLGFHFHLRFGVRGIGLRSMGPVAGWSLGIVGIDQVVNVITTRILTSAPSIAERTLHMNQFDVAGNATYQNAYTLYILPYSLIATSVATALFPQSSQAIATKDLDGARTDLSSALRTVGVIMCFFSSAFIVMPLAITRSLLPTVGVSQALLICGPLVGMSICLPLASAYLLIQRTFYAFEDGRSPFMFMALMYALQLVLIFIGTRVFPATDWATMVGLCMSLAYVLSFTPLVVMLRKRFNGQLDGRRIAVTYGKALLAAAVTIIIGMALRNPVYSLAQVLKPRLGVTGWILTVLATGVLAVVLLVIYVAVLWVLRCAELMGIIATLKTRFGRKSAAPQSEPSTAAGESAGTAPAVGRRISASTARPVEMPPSFPPSFSPSIPPSMPPSFPPSMSTDLPAEPYGQIEQLGVVEPIELAENPVALQDNQSEGLSRPTSGNSRIESAYRRAQSTDGEHMRPHLGDTVLNRYTLVSPLREEPGLQAWKANDRVLSRDCQLFIVNNKAVLKNTNAVAGTLAATKDPRFTPVLQLLHDGPVAVVLTQLDAGVSLTEYLQRPDSSPLSYEAMRTVIGETGKALASLQRDHLTHHAVSTDTVRITVGGIQLADASISTALADTSGASPADNDERLAVRQLASVLYGMLTRRPSTFPPKFNLNDLPADVPMELFVICKRGLELQDGTTPTIPLLTLNELEALLGPYKPLHMLTRHDLRIPNAEGACSVVYAPVRPILPSDLLELPDSLISSQTLPSLTFASTAGPEFAAVEVDDEDETPGEKTESMPANSFKALWNKSKAYMEGGEDAASAIPEISPADATEMFSAFDPNAQNEPPMQPSRMTVPVDVSGVRDGSMDATRGVTTTGRIPLIDDQGNEVPNGTESQRALEEERKAIDAAYAAGTPALPPSFAPQSNPGANTNPPRAFTTTGEEKKRSKGATAAVIVVIVALVAVLGVAIHSLATGGTLFGFGKQNTNYWPSDADIEKVPFGTRSGEDVQNKSKEPSEEVKPTPTPTETKKPENTTAYPVASQRFLDRPGGQQGYGYYIHLDKKEDVSKIVIKIQSSGGKGYIRVNTNGDPNAGEQVAEFTFAEGGTTEVKLDKSVNTQDIVMWVPIDSLPGNQLYINSMQAF